MYQLCVNLMQFYLNTHITCTVKQPLLLGVSKRDVRVGHSVWVYAKNFDSEKAVEKWSESNFGARGGSTMLLGKVKEIINSSDFVIYFLMTVQKWKSAGNIFMY